MITREFPPISGGIGFFVYYLSKYLIQKGHEVTVITRGSFKNTEAEIVDRIVVFRMPFFPIYPFHILVHGIFVNKLIKSLESKIDLIHMHTPLPPQIKTSLPILTTVHSTCKHIYNNKYYDPFDIYSMVDRAQSIYLYPLFESKLFNISKKITAVSHSVAMELKEYGLNPAKINVIGNGVDTNIFLPIRNKKSKEKYILFSGILRAGKGLFDFIECSKLVSKELPDLKFIICGTGPLKHMLEEKVHRMGLQNRIVFLGFLGRKELIQTYQNATVFVVPSYQEGLPTVLLEAMSCGLPVVATNVGGISEVILSGINGLLIPPKSPHAMAKSILSLLNDESLRKEIGREARKTTEKYYSWHEITNKILDLYEETLKE